MRSALASVDLTATAWAAALATGGVATTMSQASLAPTWLSVSIDVGADLRVSTVLELGDAKVAAAASTSISATLQSTTAMLSGAGAGTGLSALSSVTVASSGTTLRLGITLTDAELRASTTMLRVMLP